MYFSKYVGAGNDFILIDNRNLEFSKEKEYIAHLCKRQLGIGADGLILLENSDKADYKMKIFNSDGSLAEMCGNGIRCLFGFIQECGGKKSSYLIETEEALIDIALKETSENEDKKFEYVKVKMQEPFDMRWNIPLKLGSTQRSSPHFNVHYLNTGVPHLILFLDNETDFDADFVTLARQMRYHETFLPKGANVNFVKIKKQNALTIRTYERGVEDETLGCGTGATAAAIAAKYIFNLTGPIRVETKSLEELEIDCIINEGIIKEVTMMGPIQFVYKGQLLLKEIPILTI